MNSTIQNAVDTATNAAGNLKSEASDVASSARSSLHDYGKMALKGLAALRSFEREALESTLGSLGLQRKSSAFTPALWFAAGAVVGGGAALVFAPSSGQKFRKRLATWIGGGVDEIEKDAKKLEDRIGDGIVDAKKQISNVAQDISHNAKQVLDHAKS